MADSSVEPSATLYVRNLHEKIKLETLIKSLTLIFSPYGTILDLQCKRHFRVRGQAFIVFETIDAATKALAEVNGFPLFSKPMDVQYAKEKSYVSIEDKETLETVKAARVITQAEKRASVASAPPAKRVKKGTPDEFAPPNKILFLQGLGADVGGSTTLVDMFSQFEGYVEVRLVPGKSDLAFVEFGDEAQATVAKEHLSAWEIDGKRVSVSFAKR